MYKLETATAADRAELLAYLQNAFLTNDPNHPKFETLYPDLFAATDASMANHRIIREDGKIVACVGYYPMKVRVGECAMTVYGIGQVSCKPELRGGGRMTELMNDVCDKMDASGAELAWLSGRRDRYSRFGFESAGTNFHSWIDARSVGEAEPGWVVEQVQASQIERFDALRRSAAVYEDAPLQIWFERLMRGGKPQRIFVASRKGKKKVGAYCLAQAEGGQNVYEWAGENAGIRAILAHIAKTQGNIAVTYAPESTDPAARVFWNASSGISTSVSMLRICNLDALMKAYAPVLEKRGTNPADVAKALKSLKLDRLMLTRLVFGPVAPSVLLSGQAKEPVSRWLDQIFPLPFILPNLSHV